MFTALARLLFRFSHCDFFDVSTTPLLTLAVPFGHAATAAADRPTPTESPSQSSYRIVGHSSSIYCLPFTIGVPKQSDNSRSGTSFSIPAPNMMATTTTRPHLLTIPREIRHEIYGYLHYEIRIDWHWCETDHPDYWELADLTYRNAPLLNVLLFHSRLHDEYLDSACFKDPMNYNRSSLGHDPRLHVL